MVFLYDSPGNEGWINVLVDLDEGNKGGAAVLKDIVSALVVENVPRETERLFA